MKVDSDVVEIYLKMRNGEDINQSALEYLLFKIIEPEIESALSNDYELKASVRKKEFYRIIEIFEEFLYTRGIDKEKIPFAEYSDYYKRCIKPCFDEGMKIFLDVYFLFHPQEMAKNAYSDKEGYWLSMTNIKEMSITRIITNTFS